MPNLIDTNVLQHVLVITILIIFFILLLQPWKVRDNDQYEKYDRIADAIIRCMAQCRTLEELKMYESEADDFYLNNYDFIGHDKSVEIYMRIADAVNFMRATIERQNKLNHDRISS